MRRKLFSLILIGLGTGLWWIVNHSAQLSSEKWNFRFESTLRNELLSYGLSDSDILSRFNQIETDGAQEWVQNNWEVKAVSAENRQKLKDMLERTGAQVEEIKSGDQFHFVVRRGQRIYQKIYFSS